MRTTQARAVTLHPTLELVGSIEAIPENTSILASMVSGVSKSVSVVEGSAVEKGDVLVHLDERLLEAEAARAAAAVMEHEAVLERLRKGPRPEELEVARQEVSKSSAVVDSTRARLRALQTLKDTQEVSTVRLEEAAAAVRAAEADRGASQAALDLLLAGTRREDIAQATARLELARADQETARLRLSFTEIRAPRSGTVTRLSARQGEAITTSTPLATVVDLSSVHARLRIPSASLADVVRGASVLVRVASLPGTVFEGTLERLGRRADPATSGVEALVRIQNPDRRLLPGLACRAAISLPAIDGAVVIPKAAVADRSGTAVVTVVRDGRAFEVPVQLGALVQDQVSVTSGIEAGDTIITEGGYALPDGYPVRARE